MARLFLNGSLVLESVEDRPDFVAVFDQLIDHLEQGKSAILSFPSPHISADKVHSETYIPAGTVVTVEYTEAEKAGTAASSHRSSDGGASLKLLG